jgi:hypothetical protein
VNDCALDSGVSSMIKYLRVLKTMVLMMKWGEGVRE